MILVFLPFISVSFVSATNGCFPTDPECGSTPTNNCDVRQNTTFNPGTYNLPSGIDICANNIVLDCNDNNIVGGLATGTGIRIADYNNTIIQNCKISAYSSSTLSSAISISSSINNTIINNTIISNYNGIILSNGNSHFINKNQFKNNQYGIQIINTNNTKITNNTFNSTQSNIYAIYIPSFSVGNKIWRNTFFIKTAHDQFNTASYCLDVGNLYFAGAGGNRAFGDCGPLPNINEFRIHSNYSNPIEFNSLLTGIFYTNSLTDAAANANAFGNQTVILEPNSGLYQSESVFIDKQNSTSIDCSNNILNGTTSVNAITVTNSNKINIKNCRIQKYNYGISLQSSVNINIFDNNISSNSRGVGVSAQNVSIDGNVFSSNSNGAIRVPFSNYILIENNTFTSGGVILTNATDSIIRLNNFSANGVGLFVDWLSKRGVIENNIFKDHPYLSSNAGITIRTTDYIVQGNIFSNNNFGVHLYAAANITIQSNIFSPSNGAGIYMPFSNNITIRSNSFSSNLIGIKTAYSTIGGAIENNTFTSHSSYDGAIYLDNGDIFTIKGNNLTNNYRGINLLGSDNNIILNNIISNNYQGISLNAISYNTEIHFNNIYNNGYNVYNGQPQNVLAEFNWWGTTNVTQIAQSIFDGLDNPIYGIVDFTPFLNTPFGQGIIILTQILSAGQLGQFSSDQFTAVGGNPPYTWSIIGGNIPSGMNFYPNGVLNGTPTNAGNFTFTVRVTDTNNSIAEKTFTKEVYVTLPPQQVRLLKGGTTPVPGRIIDYLILFENIGNVPATNYTIMEIIEPWLTFISASPQPTNISNSTIFWSIPYLGPYEFSIFHYRARLNSSMPVGATVAGGPAVLFQVPGAGTGFPPGTVFPPSPPHPFHDCLYEYGQCMNQISLSCIPSCVPFPGCPGPPSFAACSLCFSQGRQNCAAGWNACMAGLPFNPLDYISVEIPTRCPQDPNEKVGPNKFIKRDSTLGYSVHFENIGNTDAQDIFVNDTLDIDLNISTLKVIANNGTIISLQQNETVLLFQQEKNITIPVGNLSINITVNETWTVHLTNRIIYWNLTNIYLPPNATGELLFSIKPKQNLSSGTEILNNATIQFETLSSLTTNSTLNIIDEIPPSCSMNPLPNITTTMNFTISWNGSDPVGEIKFYTIFASTEGNGLTTGFTPLINLTTSINTIFTGQQGKTYRFICIATDTAGNIEVQPPIPEATTTIPNPTFTILGTPNPGNTLTINLNDPVNSNTNYIIALAKGTDPGILLSDGRLIPLNGDGLFFLSLFYANLIGFNNAQGTLNSNGQATATWTIPIFAPAGLTVYLAFVTINPALLIPQAILGISNAVPVTIQ